MKEKKSINTHIQIRTVHYGSGEYNQEVALRHEVLRLPIGRSIYDEDLRAEQHVVHMGAFIEDELVGTLYLKCLDETTSQIKQVAVKELYRGLDIGRKMIRYAEDFARNAGVRELILDSRATATGFYEKLGFVNTKVEVQYFDLPHFKMRKMLV